MDNMTNTVSENMTPTTTVDRSAHYMAVLGTVLYGSIWPVIIIVGIVGNILTLIVLKKMKDSSATSHFLRGLAVADTMSLCILGAHMVMVWGQLFWPERYLRWRLNSFSFSKLSHFSERISKCIIMVIVLERIVGVTWPLRYKRMFTPMRSSAIVMVIFVTMIATSLPISVDVFVTDVAIGNVYPITTKYAEVSKMDRNVTAARDNIYSRSTKEAGTMRSMNPIVQNQRQAFDGIYPVTANATVKVDSGDRMTDTEANAVHTTASVTFEVTHTHEHAHPKAEKVTDTVGNTDPTTESVVDTDDNTNPMKANVTDSVGNANPMTDKVTDVFENAYPMRKKVSGKREVAGSIYPMTEKEVKYYISNRLSQTKVMYTLLLFNRLVFDFLPIPFVFVGNVIIISQLRRRHFSKFGCSADQHRCSQERKITKLLLLVSVAFLLLCGPFVLYTILLLVGISQNGSALFLGEIFKTMSLVNNSINFIIYAVMSKTYRQGYRSILCYVRRGKENNVTPEIQVTPASYSMKQLQRKLYTL